VHLAYLASKDNQDKTVFLVRLDNLVIAVMLVVLVYLAFRA